MLKKFSSLEKAEVKIEAERRSDRPHLSPSLDLSLPRALHSGREANGN
jgi:hypothetical protein